MLGQERTVLPVPAEAEFGLAAYTGRKPPITTAMLPQNGALVTLALGGPFG
jgi:hypothetical protein